MMAWFWDRAVCRVEETSAAPELWTADRRPARSVFVELEQMCRRCPVRRRCAEFAVRTEAECGMYGGVLVPNRSQDSAWAAARDELRDVAGMPDGAEAGSLGVSA
jgi:WhiB family redox-sensing transcriptional regulator